MLKSLVPFLLIALAALPAVGQTPTNKQGYSTTIASFGNLFRQLRTDSAQHIPHKYGLTQNTTDSTPQLFAWSTASGDSLVLFVNGRYIIIGKGAFVANNGNATGIQAGSFSLMPLPGHLGNFYAATDSLRWYYDNGSAWLPFSGGGGSGGGGSGSGYSMHTLTSSNFSTGTACPLPALNNDSLQIFWNDLGRFLVEGSEWQTLGGGGFSILVPGFNASTNSYQFTLYANSVAIPPGPQAFTSSNFSTSVNCPITAYNGMTLQIFWNDADRYLAPGTDWTPLTGGGFTITISGFNATTTNYSFYVFAQ